jgi:hypothetical protein
VISSFVPQIMQDVLGPQISNIFDCMEVAEKEIFRAKTRYPEKADTLENSFMYMVPPVGYQRFGMDLYKAHVLELLEHVASGENVANPTKSEILMMLSSLSEKAPLQTDACKLYYDLFTELFPKYEWTGIDPRAMMPNETFKGAADELRQQIIRTLKPQISEVRRVTANKR